MRVSPVQGVRSLPSAQLQKTTDERRRQARLTGFIPHETYLESHDDADDDVADGDGDGDGDGDDGEVPRAAQTGLRVPWPVRASDSYS